MRPQNIYLLGAVCFAFLTTSSLTVSGRVLDWGGSLDLNWASAENWTPERTPTAGDQLVFQGSLNTSTINDLFTDTLINGIDFTNTANDQNFLLSGNRIVLDSDIQTTAVADPSSDLIEDEITLAIVLITADIGLNTGTGHNLKVSGVISGAQQLEINNGSRAQDDGVVTLFAANTYTAGTLLRGGTLDRKSVV